MKVVRRICTLIAGIVFFIAGILKLMDPTGAGLVVAEYLKFLNLSFLTFAAKPIAMGLSFVECFAGAALLTGVWRRVTGIVSGVMLLSFTMLTVLLVIFNPPMDCGCFGEAVHLTHTQTLVKNLVLLALMAIAFVPSFENIPVLKVKYASFAISVISVVAFAVYCSNRLPLVDFTEYAPGKDLTENILSFSDMDGEYCDSTALKGAVMIVSVYDVEGMTVRDWTRISDFLDMASGNGYVTMLLVASTPDVMMAVPAAQSLLYQTYYADRKTLLTLDRSNGGAVFADDGIVVRKWSSGHLPSFEDLSTLSDENPTEAMARNVSGDRLRLQAFLLYVFAVMLLV